MDWQKLKLDKVGSLKVLHAPDGIDHGLESVDSGFGGLVAFVQTRDQLNHAIEMVRNENRPLILVIAFPKKSSKLFSTEVNRDDIMHAMLDENEFGGPFLVSLDNDWSGFKFRFPA
ncbi:hypothetical protein KQI63_11025 [bacterium]|nr:hypothetical protein [bacterium]